MIFRFMALTKQSASLATVGIACLGYQLLSKYMESRGYGDVLVYLTDGTVPFYISRAVDKGITLVEIAAGIGLVYQGLTGKLLEK